MTLRAGELACVVLKELEWVIQNARIVLEYAQLHASMRTRDESMADNIKWIADQNPGARIIVWRTTATSRTEACRLHANGQLSSEDFRPIVPKLRICVQ